MRSVFVCVCRLRAGKHVRPRDDSANECDRQEAIGHLWCQLTGPSTAAVGPQCMPPFPHPPLATAHATDPPPRHVFHHSCAGASSPSLVGRTHVKERERDTEWDSWESAAALLEWPFLVATSFSTSFFSWPANVAARGRTESAHIEKEWERKCRRKHTSKALSKAQVN